MARSQESFSKKEREKKKQKRKKEKAEKKAERKAEGGDKKTLEEMFMYVDEFGNLSPTPPDPAKKKKFKKEDIEISVPKQGEEAAPDPIRKGTVKFFNDEKGYGFIIDKDTNESIFVHANNLMDEVQERDRVVFEVEMGPKGPNAVRVKLFV